MVQGKKPKALWEEIRLQDNWVCREVTTAEKAVGHASHTPITTARVECEVSSTLSDSRYAIWILAMHLRASLLAENHFSSCCQMSCHMANLACKHVSVSPGQLAGS